jgi:hypothetical protein
MMAVRGLAYGSENFRKEYMGLRVTTEIKFLKVSEHMYRLPINK